MVSEKEGWSKTKERSLEERDGVEEGGVVGDQREKLRGERGGRRPKATRRREKKNLTFFYFIWCKHFHGNLIDLHRVIF